MADKAKTIVEYFAEHERYKCGYCGKKDTNYSHGMWAHALNVQDYQDLLDRGWRRSGKYTYKPTMNMTCCPQYTIRCEVLDFKLRKSHKKVLKKVNKYLIHGIKPSKDDGDDIEDGQSNIKPTQGMSTQLESKPSTSGEPAESVTLGNQTEQTPTQSEQTPVSTPVPSINPSETDESKGRMSGDGSESKSTIMGTPEGSNVKIESDSSTSNSKEVKRPRPGSGMDPTKPVCKKAKDIRREKKLAKLSAKGVIPEHPEQNSTSKKQPSKTLEDILNEPHKAENCAHKLEIRLVRSNPESPEFRDSLTESHSVYHRYQMSVHGDDADKPVLKQYKRFLVDSPLEVRLVRSFPKSDEFSATLDESFKVYNKYQVSIHKDSPGDCSISTYTSFLVDSPLEEEYEEGGLPAGYGSFHQQYILDGKIICVGVLDILPSLVSSKYLYYDPDYNFLSLGTYSALQEIAFIRSLHEHSKNMLYYYMGFYIHSCPKMKYKGQYYPSYLLCPETYTWHPVEKCAPLLDRSRFSRFADHDQVDAQGTPDFSSLLVLHNRRLMSYEQYLMLTNGKNDDEEEVMEYANFVGRKCASRMLLFRK